MARSDRVDTSVSGSAASSLGQYSISLSNEDTRRSKDCFAGIIGSTAWVAPRACAGPAPAARIDYQTIV
jgi:hypothetical protein